MKRTFILLLLAFVVCFSSACTNSVQQKSINVATTGIYAVQESLKQGRVDLAQKYVNEVVRIVPPPKKKIEIKPVQVQKQIVNDKGKKEIVIQKYVVLPQEYTGTPVLTIGSPELTKIVLDNPEIKTQFKKEEKASAQFTEKVDDTQRETIKEAEKPKKNWWSSLMGFFGLTGIISGLVVIGGLIGTALIFPGAFPILASRVGVFISNLIKSIPAFISGVFKKKPQ